MDAMDYYKATPLMFASKLGHVPIVKALLDKGANINYQNKEKQTALHYAVLNDHLPVVEVLVESGPDRSLRDIWNRTPLEMARGLRKKSIVDYLSSH